MSSAPVHSDAPGRIVRASVNYALASAFKPRFHANDHGLDTVPLDPRVLPIIDARYLADPPTLEREGLTIMRMPTAVADWRDSAQVAAIHPAEVIAFAQALTGADAVVMSGPASLRFGERSPEAGSRDNSNAARLIHSDTSHSASFDFAEASNPYPERKIRRVAQHNIWRTFSGAPQDVPLAMCDARSVADGDVILAEAAFDRQGKIIWSFEAVLLRYNPAHRWLYYSNMDPEEVLVFKRHDTDTGKPCMVPHTGFTDPSAPADAIPRASVEVRTIAYWYD